jgi:hypothetical protein
MKEVLRGRPPTFLLPERQRLARLIREWGIAGAHRRANVSVSKSTLLKIARENDINLPKGRRRKAA